jgi:biofilm PGA synthesis N-glycosyltransferase PgaC
MNCRSGDSAAQGEGLYWRYEGLIKRMETLIWSTAGVSGELLAVRREHFVPFPPGTINDDATLALAAMRRGERVVYEPDARCWEVGSTSLADDRVRRARMTAGRWQIICTRKALPWNRPLTLGMYLSHKVLRLLLPLFMACGLAANLAVLLLAGSDAAMMALLVLQLGAVAIALTGAVAERFDLGLGLTRLAWYFLLGHWSSLIGLARFMAGGQSPLWQMASRGNLPGPTTDPSARARGTNQFGRS